jgi:CRP-like cAMP-binding protein
MGQSSAALFRDQQQAPQASTDWNASFDGKGDMAMDISTYGLDAAQLQSTQFRELLVRDWITLLERSRLVRILRGETLLRQGLASPGLYIVKRGRLRVEHGKPGGTLVLGRRGPGELLGEMSVLEHTDAMASVVAEEDSEAYFIPNIDLIDLLGEEPGFATRYYRSLAIHLSARLRESAMLVEQVQDRLDGEAAGNSRGPP